MSDQNDVRNFSLYIECDYIEKDVFVMAEMVRDDPKATPREKMLAMVCLRLGKAFNRTIDSLSHGTTYVTVHEPPRIGPRLPRPKRQE